MGTLESPSQKRRCALSAQHLVGRSRRCDLVLERAEVSSQHALLRWTAQGWELRDLGSRNGSFVDGLPVEGSALLRAGAALSFGHVDEHWILSEAGPPLASAEGPEGQVVTGGVDLLALPGPEQPEVTLYVDAKGRWVMESAQALTPVASEDSVSLSDGRWTLRLPDTIEPTVERAEQLRLDALRFEFSVSADEEYVELVAHAGARRLELGARTTHYLLLTLARLRLDEATLEEGERGWIDKESLGRMLRLDELQLNLQVFRARKQLRDAGVDGAAGLIERRVGTGQLRLAPCPVEIRGL